MSKETKTLRRNNYTLSLNTENFTETPPVKVIVNYNENRKNPPAIYM